MKILYQDTKTGKIKVRIDTMDDLWHLKNVLDEEDVVSAITFRREETQSDKIRSERGEKKKMRLDIEVEKIEFHEFTDRLRILGIIVDGPQDLGSHHTLNLTEGDELTIIKDEWKDHELERLKEAVDQSQEPIITFLGVEQDEATISVLRQYGIKEMGHISKKRGGKMYDSEGMTDEEFFEMVLERLKMFADEEGGPLVIYGPGFFKEDLFKWIREKEPSMVEHAEVIPAGDGGMTGAQEVLKKGKERDALDGQRMSYESEEVEELLTEIKKDEAYAYGDESVERAVDMGAVEKLLILDERVREEKGERLMKETEEKDGDVVVISSTHEGGEKLEALGGLGALLRYKIE